MQIKARFEFKLQDCWIGAFWKKTSSTWVQEKDQTDGDMFLAHKADRLDIWLCLLPCVPLHCVIRWNERLMSEEEIMRWGLSDAD